MWLTTDSLRPLPLFTSPPAASRCCVRAVGPRGSLTLCLFPPSSCIATLAIFMAFCSGFAPLSTLAMVTLVPLLRFTLVPPLLPRFYWVGYTAPSTASDCLGTVQC